MASTNQPNQTGTVERYFTPPNDRPPHNRVALTSGGHARYFPDGSRETHNGLSPVRYAPPDGPGERAYYQLIYYRARLRATEPVLTELSRAPLITSSVVYSLGRPSWDADLLGPAPMRDGPHGKELDRNKAREQVRALVSELRRTIEHLEAKQNLLTGRG